MKKQKCLNHELYPNRYKQVILSFTEPEMFGNYAFHVPKMLLSALKKSIDKAGGSIEFENASTLHYVFFGEGAVLKVHDLALPYMYKY